MTGGGVFLTLIKAAGIKSRDSEIKSRRGAGPFAGHSQLLACASVLCTLPPAAPPASLVVPALAPARGMLGRALYAAAFFLLLIYTMDSQPTDKVEGVGDDFVRGGQDETPIKPRRNSRQRRIVVSAGTPTVKVTAGNEQFCAPWTAESPGGTVTTSAYTKDGKKRCLSAEGGSGDPKKTVLAPLPTPAACSVVSYMLQPSFFF